MQSGGSGTCSSSLTPDSNIKSCSLFHLPQPPHGVCGLPILDSRETKAWEREMTPFQGHRAGSSGQGSPAPRHSRALCDLQHAQHGARNTGESLAVLRCAVSASEHEEPKACHCSWWEGMAPEVQVSAVLCGRFPLRFCLISSAQTGASQEEGKPGIIASVHAPVTGAGPLLRTAAGPGLCLEGSAGGVRGMRVPILALPLTS